MRRARAHQNGYIFRKGNYWYLRYYDRVIQPDGTELKVQKCHQLIAVGGKYQNENSVRVLADEFLAPFNNGTITSASTASLGDFMEQRYLPWVKLHREASTYTGYNNMFTLYLKGPRTEIALRDVHTAEVDALLTEIVNEFDVGKTTVQHIKSLLSGVFTFAKRQGILHSENPVHDAELPKSREPEGTYAYSLAEILSVLAILDELPDKAASAAVSIAGFAGLREGENRGTRWECYDGRQIQVAKSVWRGKLKDPKSRASKAPVPVIAPLARRLDAYRVQCGSPATGWMFPNSAGKPRCLDELARVVIRPAFQKAGVPWHGWHAFRRGLATNLHRLGVPDKLIQVILRHANLSVTQSAYIKVVQPEAVEAMKKLEDATDEQLRRRRKPLSGAVFQKVAPSQQWNDATIMQPINFSVNLAGRRSN